MGGWEGGGSNEVLQGFMGGWVGGWVGRLGGWVSGWVGRTSTFLRFFNSVTHSFRLPL